MEFADGDLEGFGLAVAENAEVDGLPGRHLADGNLQGAAVDDLLAVEFAQHVAALQSGTACGRVRRDLADDRARRVGQVEEAGVLRRHVVHADAEVAVMHGAGLDDRLGRGAGDLRGNGESCTGERAVAGNDERVDADQFAVRVDQRSAGVAGVDGGVGLDEVARFARVVAVRVGPVERADDAARDRELEVAEGAAEGEHGLAGMQLRRVAPGDAGQVVRVDLDDGEVVELVDADQLGGKDAAVIEGDVDLHGAVDDVVVGEDVAVGREDDAAADAVFNLLLLRHALHAALGPKPKKRRNSGGRSCKPSAGVRATVRLPSSSASS